MALPTMQIFHGQPVYGWAGWTFFGIAQTGHYAPPHQHSIALVTDAGERIVFKGDFTIQGGAVVGGTVTGFSLFEGSLKLATATGYSVDYADFAAAITLAEAHDVSKVNDLFFHKLVQIGSPD